MHKFSCLILIIFLLPFKVAFAEDVFDSISTQHQPENKQGYKSEEILDIFAAINESDAKYFKHSKFIVLNKITANSKEFLVNVGSKISYGKAEIQIDKCVTASVFKDDYLMLVTLKEKSSNNDLKLIFSGWIFAKNPSLSAVEHPVYQIIAVSCS